MIDVLNSFHCTNAVQKVINIKKCTKLVIERFGEDIPRSFEELLQLPGVGPKVASCVWNSAHAMCASVAVDTHVHVICNRLGFAASTAAEQTRVQLERWLPAELWADLHAMLVPHGEWVCRKLDPHCHRCGAAKYCAYNRAHGIAPVADMPEYKFDIEDLDRHVAKPVRERLVNFIKPFRKKEGVQTKIDD